MPALFVPTDFVCPITKKLMLNPMMAKSGYNFERDAIVAWVTEYGTCPLSRKPLQHHDLITNHSLKQKIQFWCHNNGVAWKSSKHSVCEAMGGPVAAGVDLDADEETDESTLQSLNSLTVKVADMQQNKLKKHDAPRILSLQEAAMMLPIVYEHPSTSKESNPYTEKISYQIARVLVEL
jgi:U-box domain